ncbi:hypothetical protein PSU4_26660 [Pseudonocardia sulfidoxydans NBRC 16205]|uniref:VWFA domain-containing protein n=1 Tax=Pseudonocardia sulfidoxydans NBRC 16205 TaxID=1223511 RepID=A0A511DG04_9PSEU|nr:hypothetical protein PSU4_26660 [Pseudonocardia sulfidoxydans NBRC 16205]
MQPLRRKPKQLDDLPSLFGRGGAGGTPLPVEAGAPRATSGDADRRTPAATLTSAANCELRDLGEILEDRAPDEDVARMAHRIAARLSIRRRPRDLAPDAGGGHVLPMRYRHRSDDVDLDRTMDVLTEHPFPDDTDIVVRERVGTRRSVVLIVDVSGSMRGEKVRMAAATVAALTGDLGEHELALVAFWSDAALLGPLHAPVPGPILLDRLLRIRTGGLTNVHFGLSVGAAELARSAARQRTAILLTDAIHNAGPDPRTVASRFPRLHVLLQTDGEHDAPLAADIARLGRGSIRPVRTYRDVAPALNVMLGRT